MMFNRSFTLQQLKSSEGRLKMKVDIFYFCVKLILLFGLNSAEVWRKESVVSAYKIIQISKYLDLNITGKTIHESSPMMCSLQCTGSDSFYYIDSNATCICNSGTQEDEIEYDVNDDVIDTAILYGLKTTNIVTSYLQVCSLV